MLMIDGIVRYGDGEYAIRAAPKAGWADVLVDGVPKVLEMSIVERLLHLRTSEPGLELPDAAWRAA
jgi:hypothetical protein